MYTARIFYCLCPCYRSCCQIGWLYNIIDKGCCVGASFWIYIDIVILSINLRSRRSYNRWEGNAVHASSTYHFQNLTGGAHDRRALSSMSSITKFAAVTEGAHCCQKSAGTPTLGKAKYVAVRQTYKSSITSSTSMDVWSTSVLSCWSLCLATLTAKSTRTLVNKDTTSKETRI